MKQSRVQFQKCLHQFVERCGSQLQCAQAPGQPRCPQGFSCTACGRYQSFCSCACRIFQCNLCGYLVPLASDALLAGTRRLLTIWFWFLARHRLTQAKHGRSFPELVRQLGGDQNAAWKLKLTMQAPKQRQGVMQCDDADGAKECRSGRPPFVAALESPAGGHTYKLRINRDAASAGSSCATGRDGTVPSVRCQDAWRRVTDGGSGSCAELGLGWGKVLPSNAKGSLVGIHLAFGAKHWLCFQEESAHCFDSRSVKSSLMRLAASVCGYIQPIHDRLLT